MSRFLNKWPNFKLCATAANWKNCLNFHTMNESFLIHLFETFCTGTYVYAIQWLLCKYKIQILNWFFRTMKGKISLVEEWFFPKNETSFSKIKQFNEQGKNSAKLNGIAYELCFWFVVNICWNHPKIRVKLLRPSIRSYQTVQFEPMWMVSLQSRRIT